MTVVDATPTLFVPADSGFRDMWAGRAGRERLRRSAIIAAALLHAAVIAALLVQWPFVFTPVPEKPPITVALVVEPPPPAPLPPQPKPVPEPEPPQERHSGPDQQTSAPPQAETKAPAAAPKPAEQEEHPEDKTAEFPALKFRRPTPPSPTVRPVPKEAERETAPEPVTRSALHVEIGELKDGDPYLNELTVMIEQHRFYPSDAVGAFGKRLTGIVVYRVALSSAGQLVALELKTSSGSDTLDEAASTMIKRTAPFPPLPAYVHANAMVLEWAVRIFPPGQ
jgi:TonB family protein